MVEAQSTLRRWYSTDIWGKDMVLNRNLGYIYHPGLYLFFYHSRLRGNIVWGTLKLSCP